MPELSESSKYLSYLTIYFGILNLIPFLSMLMVDKRIKPFPIVDIIAVYSIFLSIIYVHEKLYKNSWKLTILDFFVFSYLFISILSFFLYFLSGNATAVIAYVYGIHYLVFPIFLFFSVKLLSYEQQKILIKRIIFFNLFIIVIGFLMSYLRPEFYTAFLQDILSQKGYLENFQLYARMQSYLGSTAVGNIAAVTILLITLVEMKLVHKMFIFWLMLLAGLLSQQRSAIVMTAIAATYFIFSRDKPFLKKTFFLFISVLIILSSFFLFLNNNEQVNYYVEYTFQNRIFNDLILGNPLKERESSYINGWNIFLEYPFGVGLGATTNAASAVQENRWSQVVDANFMRILADLGILGLIVFFMIFVFSIKKSFKHKEKFAWMLIILVYFIQAIGTNVFDSYYIAHSFWLLLGILDTKSKYVSQIHNLRNNGINESTN